LPVRVGIAHVDRLTGEPRWFADGLEESLAAMSTGPDGSLYLSHSPLRRAFASPASPLNRNDASRLGLRWRAKTSGAESQVPQKV